VNRSALYPHYPFCLPWPFCLPCLFYLLVVGLLLAGLPSCAVFQVTRDEEQTLARLQEHGLRRTEAGAIPPTMVALANAWGPLALLFGPQLGVFPLGGAGNFFLADRVPENASAQRRLGVVNSLLWPLSPLWSVAQVVADTRVVNEKETAFFYSRTVRGAAALAAWDARARAMAAEFPPRVPETPLPAIPPETTAPPVPRTPPGSGVPAGPGTDTPELQTSPSGEPAPAPADKK
jgi:hypothetical protein